MVVVGGCAPESSLGVVVIISVGGRYREKRRMGVTCRCGSLCSWCRAHLPPYISPPSLRQDSTKQRAETKADTHTQKTGEREAEHTHTGRKEKRGEAEHDIGGGGALSLSPPPPVREIFRKSCADSEMFLATSPPKDFAALCSLLLFSSSRVWMMRGSVAIVCTSTIGTQPRFILPLNSTPHYRLAHIFPVNRGRDSRCRHIEPSKKDY
jgi:hypothetical protein